MKRVVFLAATVLMTTVAASASLAADLPPAPAPTAMPTMAAPAPAPMPMPAVAGYNWTGFYLGLNAGGGWASSDVGNASGFVGGGQIGYNWQAMGSPLVLGLEADFQGTSLKNSASVGTIFGTLTEEAKVPAFGTVRGRIGYAMDRFMAYGTGGWAYSKTEASASLAGFSSSDSKWASGWTLGGGVEWAFAGPWSLKAEYLYVKAKSVDLTVAGVPFSTGDYHYNVARAGLNYRF